MSQTSGFEAGDRMAETLRRGGELNALAGPKGLEVRVNHVENNPSAFGASSFRVDRLEIVFEVFNVRQKGNPEDRGSRFRSTKPRRTSRSRTRREHRRQESMRVLRRPGQGYCRQLTCDNAFGSGLDSN